MLADHPDQTQGSESVATTDVVAGGTRTARELFTSPHAALAVGVLLLEFTAGVSTYLTAVVVPAVIRDLDAADRYPLIMSTTAVGSFLSLALAAPLLGRWGGRPVLAAGLALTVLGAVVSAAVGGAEVFALGRLAAAFGGGLLGVFGTSAVIASVPQGYRVRLLALTSAMWIVPGLLGPPAAVLLAQGVGWRVTLLLTLPLALAARILVGRAAIRAMPATTATLSEPSSGRLRTVLPTLMLPAGMAVFAFGSATAAGPYAWTGLAVALAGALLLLPPGTWRAAPGPPRYLALLAVVSFGFFGAHSMLTVIATRADGVGLGWVSAALGVAAVCWSAASLVQPRLCGPDGRRTESVLRGGVLVMAGASGAVVALEAIGHLTGPGILLCWAVAGAGMGLAYPTMYLKSITPPGAEAGSAAAVAAALATAVILAESIGSVIGTAAGSATVDAAQRLGGTEAGGLHAAMAGFTAALILAAALAACGGRRAGRDRSVR